MLTRWLLFASSYSPLLLLTGFRIDDPDLRRTAFGAAVAGAATLAAILGAARRIEPRERVFEQVEDRAGDVAGYLATYLLPFLMVEDPTRGDVAAYVGFLIVVGIVYTRGNLVAVNPLLYLFNFHLVSATTTHHEHVLVICRRTPSTGSPTRLRVLWPGLSVQLAVDRDLLGEE